MAARPGASQGGSNEDGELLCSEINCRCPIKVFDLSRRQHVSEEIFTATVNFRIHVLGSKREQKSLRQQEDRIRAEYARIEQIRDADEKAAVKLRQRIVDEALTLRCPRCQAAFVDFSGRFALHCGNNSCLTDCGNNAHTHVRICLENPRIDYFNTEQAFQDHHRRKRIQVVHRMIHTAALNTNATEKLKVLVKKVLEDLGIQMWTWRTWRTWTLSCCLCCSRN